MTEELKTMKEIMLEAVPPGLKTTKEMIDGLIRRQRQEAIKWIKRLKSGENIGKLDWTPEMCMASSNSLEEFFNITKEELK